MNGRFSEIALRKDGETYIFRFDNVSHRAFLNVLGRFAADPNLSFSWHAAAVLCKKVGNSARRLSGRHRPPARIDWNRGKSVAGTWNRASSGRKGGLTP